MPIIQQKKKKQNNIRHSFHFSYHLQIYCPATETTLKCGMDLNIVNKMSSIAKVFCIQIEIFPRGKRSLVKVMLLTHFLNQGLVTI